MTITIAGFQLIIQGAQNAIRPGATNMQYLKFDGDSRFKSTRCYAGSFAGSIVCK